MHFCALFLLLFEFVVLICNMYDVTLNLHIDSGGHIGANVTNLLLIKIHC